MSENNRRMIILGSLGLDVIFILLLTLVGGFSIGGSIAFIEIVMWVARLLWYFSPHLAFFIGRRLLHMIPTVLFVVFLGFMLIQLAPGDIFSQLKLNPDISPEQIAAMEEQFGLNDHVIIQFFKYLRNAVFDLNFGYSQTFKAPVFALVSQRVGNTLLLAMFTLAISWGFSIPAGVIAARNQYSWKDQLISVFSFMGMSLPNFFLAFLVLYLISNTGNWLPIGSMYSANVNEMSQFEKLIDLAKHMIVPVAVTSAMPLAQLTRVMRGNMLEILNMQYITTARAKGLSERVVVFKHALRNGINPMITLLGFQIGTILGGSALVEIVVNWPGLGNLTLKALLAQDLYLVVGGLLYSSALVVVGNLLADILLAVVDPRVRIS